MTKIAERPDQKEAFEIYYRLGDSRTITQLGKTLREMGVKITDRTLYDWSSKFNWTERLMQWNIEVGNKMEERAIKDVVKEKANYRKIVKLAIGEFVGQLRDGKVPIGKISDLERLIKLDLLLMGESSENVEVRGSTQLTEADRDAIKELSSTISEGFDKLED